MKTKTTLVNFILIAVFLLTACTAYQPNADLAEESGNNQVNCMPLLYPAGFTTDDIYNGDNKGDIDLPPVGWELINNKSDKPDFDLVSVPKIIPFKNGQKLVYFTSDHKVYVYNSIDKSWDSILVPAIERRGVVESKNNLILYENENLSNYLEFYRFDSETNLFVQHQIKNEARVSTIEHIVSNGDLLWVLYQSVGGSLVAGYLNLTDSEIKSENVFEISSTVDDFFEINRIVKYNLVIDQNEDLILSGNDGSLGNTVVWKLDKQGNKEIISVINKRNSPIEYSYIGVGLHIDMENNLWIGDYQWVNLNNGIDEELGVYDDIHFLYQSPVFITNRPNPIGDLVWYRPNPQANTPDGRIWYQSLRGAAWFQPETGKWCMFSSSKSNIVKDSDGNLWMVYDNALYMLPASETSKKE